MDYDDDDGEIWVKCGECDGSGRLMYPQGPDGLTSAEDDCMDCSGRGMRMGTTEDLADGAERVAYP